MQINVDGKRMTEMQINVDDEGIPITLAVPY